MSNLWRWFLAYFRLDMATVCEMSADRGEHDDFHDYPDSAIGEPIHFFQYKCKRCGKAFYI